MTNQPGRTTLRQGLRNLLEEVGAATPVRRSGPGRPAKVGVATVPVMLHMYKSQVRVLDDYADFLERLAPGNVRLSRVEVVRGLLLALAGHSLEHDVVIPAGTVIRRERDLWEALAAALGRAGAGERVGAKEGGAGR